MVAGFRHLIVLACAGAALYQPAAFAQSERDRDGAKDGVVMIRSKLPAGEAFGAGIVVAAAGQDAYIVTAKHLVERGGKANEVKVQFSQRRGEWFDARILDLQDADLDLAALLVRLPPSVTPTMLKGQGAAPSASLSRGSDVYPLGYPQSRAWDLPVAADKVASISSVKVTFQTQYVREGNSGGPLLDACGHIVGMVILWEAPNADAVRIESVLDTVARWSLPSQMLTMQPTPKCGAAAATAAVPAASTPAVAKGASIDEIRRLHEQERWAESLPLLNRLVTEQPGTPEAFALRSHAYSHLARYPEAIADGEQAVRLGPNVAEAYLRRGEAKDASGRSADGLADYDKAIKLAPKEFEAWTNRSNLFLTTGEFRKGIDSASQALKIRTDRYEPWAIRGSAYLAVNDPKAAINDLTQAIALRPGDAWIHMRRAKAYQAMQQLEPALNDVNDALRLKPDDPDILVARASIYMSLGRTDAARQDVTFALRLRPGMTEASSLLGELDKRPATAASTTEPHAPSTSAGGSSVAYARLLDQTSAAISGNRPSEAAALVDQMIGLDPSRSEGWALRGAMFHGANNLPAASEAYKAAIARGGSALFRLAHDHGAGLPPCIGNVTIAAAGVQFFGENGGHQLQWPINDITEAAINPFYGVGIGMLHIKVQAGRRTDAFNFFVVHLNDQVAINRRPEAEMLVDLISGLKRR
jgi:tetratricopeptide (TPR) repeat protein